MVRSQTSDSDLSYIYIFYLHSSSDLRFTAAQTHPRSGFRLPTSDSFGIVHSPGFRPLPREPRATMRARGAPIWEIYNEAQHKTKPNATSSHKNERHQRVLVQKPNKVINFHGKIYTWCRSGTTKSGIHPEDLRIVTHRGLLAGDRGAPEGNAAAFWPKSNASSQDGRRATSKASLITRNPSLRRRSIGSWPP